MKQNKVTKALVAIQDWGWLIGIVVFQYLIAMVSICQAYDFCHNSCKLTKYF